MIVGILSDIHDNLHNLSKALHALKELKASQLIFCGDFCAPFAAKKLAETGLPVHAIFGNNDGDPYAIVKSTKAFPDFKLYGQYIGDTDSQLIIDSIKIGVTHYPYYAKTMVKTGWYDCVFYGHNHKADKQKFGKNLLLNPGEIAGVFGPPSFAIMDTEFQSSEIIWF